MQINRWLHLSSSLWGIPLRLVHKNNRTEKFPFIATYNWIVLAVWWSVKYYFAPNSPIFQKKMWRRSRLKKGNCKRKKKDNYKALCFSSKHNKWIIYSRLNNATDKNVKTFSTSAHGDSIFGSISYKLY